MTCSGQARLDGGVPHDLRGGDGAVHRVGMGGENDGVAGLQRQHDFINGSGGRVGSGGNGGDDTLRGCNLFHAIGLVFGNDTAGLLIAHVVPDMLRGILILGDLIHNDAVAGLLAGHLGQGDPHFGHGHSRLFTDGIHLLLGKGTVRFLRCADQGKGFRRVSTELMVSGVDIDVPPSFLTTGMISVPRVLLYRQVSSRSNKILSQCLRVQSVGLSSMCSFFQ